MTCKDCAQAAAAPTWGGYDFRCPMCCARLMRSAEPDEQQVAAMEDAIRLFPQRPSRKAVREAQRALSAPPPAPGPEQPSLL